MEILKIICSTSVLVYDKCTNVKETFRSENVLPIKMRYNVRCPLQTELLPCTSKFSKSKN